MKTLLRNWMPILALGLLLAGCQIDDKELTNPELQASGEIVVGQISTQGPVLTLTQAEASDYLALASQTNSVIFSDITIWSDDDGNLFLKGNALDETEPEPKSIAAAIALETSGQTIYLRLNWKKCKGNDCSFCTFNESMTDCNCNDSSTSGKCDFSEGSVSTWSNY